MEHLGIAPLRPPRLAAWLVALAVLTCLALSAAPATAQTTQSGFVSADGQCLRLRQSPSLNGSVLTCVPDGSAVLLFDDTANADGLLWRQIDFSGLTGWAADEFLVEGAPPSPAPPPAAPTPDPEPQGPISDPVFTGTLARNGGVSIATWGGGTVSEMVTAAVTAGCEPRSFWANRTGGGLVGYLVGAPAFVNSPWTTLYPGELSPGTPLLIFCEEPDGSPPPAAPTPPPSSGGSPLPPPSLPPGIPNEPPGPAGNEVG